MTHISPYAATQGLMKGAGAVLSPGGLLFVYGPFKRGGEFTSEGNATFDASLRWGCTSSPIARKRLVSSLQALGFNP
jgi:hypothetical protein